MDLTDWLMIQHKEYTSGKRQKGWTYINKPVATQMRDESSEEEVSITNI